jgi:hypothetical protein
MRAVERAAAAALLALGLPVAAADAKAQRAARSGQMVVFDIDETLVSVRRAAARGGWMDGSVPKHALAHRLIAPVAQ